MIIPFYKYQGSGNDFIMIDNRKQIFPKENTDFINRLCDRHFGIGADGLILLENDDSSDFSMVYFNADGNQSTMCGNGGRCIVSFAKELKIIGPETKFNAIDGLHKASIKNEIVSLQMIDVKEVKLFENYAYTDTGSPHHVQIVSNVLNYPVVKEGRDIRNDLYGKEGSNVNFVQELGNNTFKVRTYERGVENETLACGTGVTAVAIVMDALGKTNGNKVTLLAEGGKLSVSFNKIQGEYRNIILHGPAKKVFEGEIEL